MKKQVNPELLNFSYEVIIKEEHLDIFNHVNNAEYLRFYESSRWSLLKRHHFSQATVIAAKAGPIILNIDLSFKRELVLNDKIEIKFTDAFLDSKYVFFIKQKIIKSEKIISDISLKMAFMNLEKRRLIPIPKDWKKAFGIET